MGTCARERSLTERQQQFVVEYLECRQTVKAAIRAGYSAKTATHSGWKLLKNPQIRRKIEAGVTAAKQTQAVGRESVMAELARMAFASSDQEKEPVRNADKLRALDILARILGLYGTNKAADEMPDLAEQLRRARLRLERMKKEDEENKFKKQKQINQLQDDTQSIAENETAPETVVEPVPPLRAKDIPFILGRHPESPFPLDLPSGHTGWQNFEFDPYEY